MTNATRPSAQDGSEVARRALLKGALATAAAAALASSATAQSGARETIIFVPGTFSDEVQFRHQMKALSDIADSRVSMRHAMHETMAGIAEGILRDAPPRFAIMGLSLGGRAALEVVRQAPERVTRIGIIASTARGGTSPARQRVAQLQKEKGYAAMVEMMIPILVPPETLKNQPLVQEIRAMVLRAGPEVADRQARASDASRDHWDYLPNIKIPALLICGKQDRIATVEEMEKTARGMPNSSFVVVDNCGHLASQEHPDAVSAAMRKWLAAS
jgi:pimeloyl-ACP methyl ester carboxylesterase